MSTLLTEASALTEAAAEQRAARPASVEVILNAAAGAGAGGAARARLAALFAAHGLTARVVAADADALLPELAERAARGDARIVVAGGGDGTVSAVAAALAGTDKVLGVLPLGTLNHFAKDLGVPLDLEAAARVVATGRVVEVDVGEVNGHVFVNNSSLGLYAHIVRQREKTQRRQGYSKWLAFAWAVLVVFKRYPFLRVRLSVDGRELERRTPVVFVGNNEYEMDGFNVGARACLDAGRLSLHVTHKAGRGRLVLLALRALFGRLRAAKDFDSLCAREVWIESRRKGKRLRVATDGEVTIMNSPLHYRVRPRALRVLVARDEG
ncbi:MAG TPA: diacylglycerol kinase family protein [Pyrinomonadaceae bacterium]|jgi:diacylglycerol kinase family enzyme